MTKITENELKNKVSRLREYLAVVEAAASTQLNPATSLNPQATAIPTGGLENPANQVAKAAPAGLDASGRKTAAADPRVGQASGATTQSTKPAGAPKVAYDKNFPAATAMELQKKLNAVGEKLTVDGKMGPATRAAMARNP